MAVTVRIALTVTFLTLFCCVHLHKLYSSYFKFSHQKQENEESEKIAEFKAETELTCSLRCSAKGNCDEAKFYRSSKKCFLYQNKGKGSTELYANDNDNTRSKVVTMKKVCINPRLINGGCTFGDDNSKDEGEDDGDNDESYSSATGDVTQKSSCSSILQQNSSSQNDFYNITVGTITWKTWCKMNAIPGCGDGAWTQVMGINGSMKTFSYDSHRWTSKLSHNETAAHGSGEIKLPGYWLSPFSRICVKMKFLSSDRRAIFLLNYTARSLYSAFQGGINNTWPGDISATEQSPLNGLPNIKTSCLVKGFNLIARAQHPNVTIKSRLGVKSQPLGTCAQPSYLVRGVGIGYRQDHPPIPEISCGEIIINHQKHKPDSHPAFCRIYIQ